MVKKSATPVVEAPVPVATLTTNFLCDPDNGVGKVTKNTIKFEEQPDAAPMIGTLYIQKWAVKEGRRVKVTIEIF